MQSEDIINKNNNRKNRPEVPTYDEITETINKRQNNINNNGVEANLPSMEKLREFVDFEKQTALHELPQ